MTHKERLAAALERQAPDQVPITWEMETRFAETITDSRGWRAICDAHRAIGSSIFNVQGIGPLLRSELPSGYRRCGETEDIGGGMRINRTAITTPHGLLTAGDIVGHMPQDPSVPKHVEYLIKERSDYGIYADFVREMARVAEPDVSEALAAYDYIGDDGLVGFWMADSVYHLAQNRRDQDFILDMLEAPQVIEDTLRAVDLLKDAELRAFNESAAEVLVYDICWASLSLVNPELVRRFVIPRAKRAVESIAPGKYIVFFQSGRIRAVVPDLVACGPDGIQHFDVLGDCDLAEIKRSFGKDICIIGNLNPVVLAHGTVEDARREAHRCLEAAKEGGGYIMSTSDEVPVDAKVENMRAIVETVAVEGKY
jgi:hypothetical protein